MGTPDSTTSDTVALGLLALVEAKVEAACVSRPVEPSAVLGRGRNQGVYRLGVRLGVLTNTALGPFSFGHGLRGVVSRIQALSLTGGSGSRRHVCTSAWSRHWHSRSGCGGFHRRPGGLAVGVSRDGELDTVVDASGTVFNLDRVLGGVKVGGNSPGERLSGLTAYGSEDGQPKRLSRNNGHTNGQSPEPFADCWWVPTSGEWKHHPQRQSIEW